MTPNIERGDTFIIDEAQHRGTHFTCVGVSDDRFYAGDTNARMWKFERRPAFKYRTFVLQEGSWVYRGQIQSETIIEE